MNKLLLFHLLFVLYSENAKSNDISLKESIGDALYFTQKYQIPLASMLRIISKVSRFA